MLKNTINIIQSLTISEARSLIKEGEDFLVILPIGEEEKQSALIKITYHSDACIYYFARVINPYNSPLQKGQVMQIDCDQEVFLTTKLLLAPPKKNLDSLALVSIIPTRYSLAIIPFEEILTKNNDNSFKNDKCLDIRFINNEEDFLKKVIIKINFSDKIFKNRCAYRPLGKGMRIFTYLVPKN